MAALSVLRIGRGEEVAGLHTLLRDERLEGVLARASAEWIRVGDARETLQDGMQVAVYTGP